MRKSEGKWFPGRLPTAQGRHHSVMALEGHSSMQAPQSMHLPASMTAMSSQVIAPSGQTSTHAPHADTLGSVDCNHLDYL